MNDYRGRKVCNIIESKFCWALHVDGERVFIYGGSVPYFKKHFEDLGYEINIVRKKGEDDADDSAKRNDKCRS
jgi:hypothetical protein